MRLLLQSNTMLSSREIFPRDFPNEMVLRNINDHVVYRYSRLEKEKLFK